MVTVQGLENRGYWLYTFGKAFAASGVWRGHWLMLSN